jgi:hypothetical protein
LEFLKNSGHKSFLPQLSGFSIRKNQDHFISTEYTLNGFNMDDNIRQYKGDVRSMRFVGQIWLDTWPEGFDPFEKIASYIGKEIRFVGYVKETLPLTGRAYLQCWIHFYTSVRIAQVRAFFPGCSITSALEPFSQDKLYLSNESTMIKHGTYIEGNKLNKNSNVNKGSFNGVVNMMHNKVFEELRDELRKQNEELRERLDKSEKRFEELRKQNKELRERLDKSDKRCEELRKQLRASEQMEDSYREDMRVKRRKKIDDEYNALIAEDQALIAEENEKTTRRTARILGR